MCANPCPRLAQDRAHETMNRLRRVGYNLVGRSGNSSASPPGALPSSGTAVVPALWISSEEIRCVSPARPPTTPYVAEATGLGSPLPSALSLEVSLNGKDYTASGLKFQ